jgi:hypothetical protein
LKAQLDQRTRERDEAQRHLAETLEQQRATAEILSVISSLPADVQPVLNTILRNFVSLCGGIMGAVYTFDGELVHFAGGYGFSPEQLARIKSRYPVRSDDRSVISARAILTKAPVHRAWLSFAPPTRRMPLGQSQDILQADPGGRVSPRS